MANIRIKHAKVDRENNHYVLVYKPDANTTFKWDWQGDKWVRLNGDKIAKKEFGNIDQFEGWCRRYLAES